MGSPAQKKCFAKLTKEYGVLATRVAELRHQLTEAERAVSNNEAEMARYAPVYTLPNDVLKLVLEELYAHKFDDQDLCCTTPHHDPLPITHVSRRWRAVALSLPTIWRCIHLNSPRQLVQLWVERSTRLPIRVICVFCEMEQDGEWALNYSRIRAILEHAPRLQHFGLSTDEPEFVCGVCELLQKQDLPALLTLALRYEACFIFGRGLMAGVRLPTCPNLKSLTLAAIPCHSSLVSCPLLRSEALQLDGCGYLNSSLLNTISKVAPALVELTLKGCCQFRRSAPSPAMLPNPRTLVLAGVLDYWSFCRFIGLSALQFLVLRNVELWPLMPVPIPLSELPGVKQLVLHCCRVPWTRRFTEVAQLFWCTPAATILSLHNTRGSDVILRGLADDDAAQMLPLLECLELTVLAGEEGSYSELLHFLEKRKSFGRPLKEVHVGQGLQEGMGDGLLRSLGGFVEVSVL